MLGVAFALVAAAGFAGSNIIGRLGLNYMKASGGVLISLTCSLLLLLVVTAIFDLNAFLSIPLSAAIWFAAAGILNFPIGRYFMFLGIRNIGVSQATAISSASPFFSVILAILLIGETLTPLILAGAVLIVVGLFILTREKE